MGRKPSNVNTKINSRAALSAEVEKCDLPKKLLEEGMRRSNARAYKPREISAGPVHRGSSGKLVAVDENKTAYFKALLDRIKKNTVVKKILEDLGMFLAKAIVDEVLEPQDLEEIGAECFGPNSIGSKALRTAKSSLKATLSGECILRCWGGGGSSKHGLAVEDVKDKIGKLLEEYESGGDIREACRCIKELGMPFFHHEVVKEALVAIMEKKNERLWDLLGECFESGLITMNQMVKGFGRVAESLDDLALDVPDAKSLFAKYVERAKNKGWLDNSFSFGKQEHATENGTC